MIKEKSLPCSLEVSRPITKCPLSQYDFRHERANSIQSGQPINDGERPIVPERVAMPCDARSSLFVVIGSPGACMKALRADDTNSHCVVRGSVAFTGAFACVHGLYSINAGQTSRLSANAAFIPSMGKTRDAIPSGIPLGKSNQPFRPSTPRLVP